MHFFSRSKSKSRSRSKRERLSMISASTSSTRPAELEEEPYHPYASLEDEDSIPLRRRTSNSNLSTTSTLLDEERKTQPRPPPLPVQLSPYEQFVAQAREIESRHRQAWARAEQRRRESNHWPVDPWRGGFGPPARDTGYAYENRVSERIARDTTTRVLNPRREQSDNGVRGWLSQNGLLRR